MKKYDIYGIGNALVDVVIEVDDSFFIENGIEKGVMTLVDEKRQQNLMESIDIKKTKIAAGGSAANTIIGLSQLGGSGAYSFVTARDELGKMFIEDMKRHKVGMNLQYEDSPLGHSGRCVVMVSPDAERTMNTFLGISSSLSKDNVSEELIKKSTYVYLEGYLVTTPGGVEAMIKSKEIAEQNQIETVLTFSDPNIVKNFSKNFQEIVGTGVDLLFCNEQEALLYAATNRLQEACTKLQQIAKRFVVTLGAKGSLVYDGDVLTEIPAHKTVQVLDTNGAGDSFAGGFLYGLTRGYSYIESAKIASIMASYVVSHSGPRLDSEKVKKVLFDIKKEVSNRMN